MSKRVPGLRLRNGRWHIECRYKYAPGGKIYESTGYGENQESEAAEYLIHLKEKYRRASLYGERISRTFREAATKYLAEHQYKRSISDDANHLEQLDPFIGDYSLEEIHDDTLKPFVSARLAKGIKTKSINLSLQVVRRILNLAAHSWRDGKHTWLNRAPRITMLKITDAAVSYPLDWDEQKRLFEMLPPHLQRMALFKVNTGNREQEVCDLRWDWEFEISDLQTSVFIVPGKMVKNGEDRIVVLNRIAKSIIEERRENRPATHLDVCDKNPCNCAYSYVFSYRGRKVGKMHTSAWKRAWQRAGLPTFPRFKKGVHNLKHTFGRRLRAAGVPLETRKVLLGHTNRDITTHYSAAELSELVDAAEKVCEDVGKTPALVLLKNKAAV